jgi:Fur family ferric uptake transcriptional regulator
VLRAAGLQVTLPRIAVYDALYACDRTLSAGEVYDMLRIRHAGIGLTTVYRVLRAFTDAGLVHVFTAAEHRYLICGTTPHVHLICHCCGRVIECPVEDARNRWACADSGLDFDLDLEQSDLRGICGDCRSAEADAVRTGAAVTRR